MMAKSIDSFVTFCPFLEVPIVGFFFKFFFWVGAVMLGITNRICASCYVWS